MSFRGGTFTTLALTLLAACSEPMPEVGRTPTGIHFESMGTGPPPVLFVHGFSLDRRMWDTEVALLQETNRVVRYDLRGHGESAPWIEPFSAVSDMLEVFDTAELQRALIVGHSAGGQVAIDFALSHPERVDGLLLLAPGLGGYRPTGSFDWMAPVGTALQEGDAEAATQAWVETPLMAIPTDSVADARMREIVLENWRIWTYDTSLQRLPDTPAIERLSEIQAPTVVVVGGRDFEDSRRVADTISACLPRVERVELAGVGHLVNLEAPDRFAAILTDFVTGGRPELARGRAANACASAGLRSP